MTETQVTFHNNAKIRVQAQIFVGRTLVSTCVADPGETHILSTESARFDIYLKNAATGWEIAHKLDSEATSVTLMPRNGRYDITEN